MSDNTSQRQRVEHSLRHSIHDGAAYSVMVGSGETYFSAFAVFLKATTAQIGFLASVPPLLASFAQLLSAWLGHVSGRRKPIILIGASLQALTWLPMLFVPWLSTEYRVEIFILCVTLYYAFANLAAPQWSSLMGELVSENRRGRYFARRTRISSMTSFLALVLAGTLLHYFDSNMATKTGYVVLFSIAFIARLVSVYHLTQLYDKTGHVAALEIPVERPTLRKLIRSPFAHFAGFFAIMQFSVYFASPFYSVYLLRDLGFSYIEFMSCSAISVLVQFLTLNRWGRVSDIFGNRVILRLTGSLIPILPFLWMLSPNFYYLVLVQAFNGLVWAGFTLSTSNFLYDLIPQNKRATYMAAHSVLSSVGLFCGALLGGYVATVMPSQFTLLGTEITLASQLYIVFILSFIFRSATSMVLIPRLKEVRRVKPVSVRRLIFKVVRFNPLSGISFDVVSSRRKGKQVSVTNSTSHVDDD